MKSRVSQLLIFFISMSIILAPLNGKHASADMWTTHEVTATVTDAVYSSVITNAKFFLLEGENDVEPTRIEWNGSAYKNSYIYERTYKIIALAPGFKPEIIPSFTVNSGNRLIDVTFDEIDTSPAVHFEDSQFQDYVGKKLFSDYAGETITEADMQYLWSIELYNDDDRSDSGYTSITGLEYAVNLDSVRIDDQLITSIEPLKNLTKIRTVQLKRNLITSLDPLSGLPNLQSVYAEENNIATIPAFSSAVLDTIDLDHNRISDLSTLSNTSSLESLSLSFNQISDISSIANLNNLMDLNLSHNLISNVPDFSSDYFNTLNLSFNRISDLSFISEWGLPSLGEFILSGNPFVSIDNLVNLTDVDTLYLNELTLSTLNPLLDMRDNDVLGDFDTIYLYGTEVVDEESMNVIELLRSNMIFVEYNDPELSNFKMKIEPESLGNWKIGESKNVKTSVYAIDEPYDSTFYQRIKITKDGMPIDSNDVNLFLNFDSYLSPLVVQEGATFFGGELDSSNTDFWDFYGASGVKSDFSLSFTHPGVYKIRYELMMFDDSLEDYYPVESYLFNAIVEEAPDEVVVDPLRTIIDRDYGNNDGKVDIGEVVKFIMNGGTKRDVNEDSVFNQADVKRILQEITLTNTPLTS